MNDLTYIKPQNLQEALAELSKKNEATYILAGGTDILISLKEGNIKPQYLLDISELSEIKGIKQEGEYLVFGAATTMQSIAESPIVKEKLPCLVSAAIQMASPQIRVRATIAGNLVTGSPIADTVPMFRALDTVLEIQGTGKKREVKLDDFILGYRKVDLAAGEMVTAFKVPLLKANQKANFIKVGRRNALAISVLNMAVKLTFAADKTVESARVVLGGVAATSVRAKNLEAFLTGKKMTEEVVLEAGNVVLQDATPIGDIRATAEGRKVLLSSRMVRLLEEFIN